MKRWRKIGITIIAVTAFTMMAFRLVAPQVLGIGYPDNVSKPPLSYRIKWLLGNKPNYTVEKKLPDETAIQVDAPGRAVQDKQTEAAEKAVSSIKPEDFQTVNSFVRQAHFQLNDLVGSGRYKRFMDNSTWASNSKEYLWESRVKEYVSGEGELNLVTRARQAAEKVGSDDLKADLETFARVMELAYEKKDVKLLILAHRIIHDLDYWVFNNETFESRDYWGATITLEGKKGSSVNFFLHRAA